MRIPDKVRNGIRVRAPEGPVLRVRVLFSRTALHGVVTAVVLAGMTAGAAVVPLLPAASWMLRT